MFCKKKIIKIQNLNMDESYGHLDNKTLVEWFIETGETHYLKGVKEFGKYILKEENFYIIRFINYNGYIFNQKLEIDALYNENNWLFKYIEKRKFKDNKIERFFYILNKDYLNDLF